MPGRDAAGAVTALAPVRVADVGGWTDTWFGAPGKVCSLAVGPGVRANARHAPGDENSVRLIAPDVARDYVIRPDASRGWQAASPGLDPLLEQAVAAIVGSHDDAPAIELTVTSAVPAGASLGTSASVVVAVLAALDALLGGHHGPADLAFLAHQVETARAGREAGVQDHWSAALGGAAMLTVPAYPRGGRTPAATSEVIALSPATRATLDATLLTVAFGPHDSSQVHRQVIASATADTGRAHDRTVATLAHLSSLAEQAADALAAGDLPAWGGVLTRCTDAQEELHAGLVGPAHRGAIALAGRRGALGWKVNGAGGDGGSLTVLLPDADARARLASDLAGHDPTWAVLPLTLADGVRLG